jgi:hypothetical protein
MPSFHTILAENKLIFLKSLSNIQSIHVLEALCNQRFIEHKVWMHFLRKGHKVVLKKEKIIISYNPCREQAHFPQISQQYSVNSCFEGFLQSTVHQTQNVNAFPLKGSQSGFQKGKDHHFIQSLQRTSPFSSNLSAIFSQFML